MNSSSKLSIDCQCPSSPWKEAENKAGILFPQERYYMTIVQHPGVLLQGLRLGSQAGRRYLINVSSTCNPKSESQNLPHVSVLASFPI